ncbi:hypothetical protein F4806DRAFT_496312 [Annulohypoxylon nitens]|nr:hypothetical protein F4806DRAFT_496312 [Annulohypoxylon nitens]
MCRTNESTSLESQGEMETLTTLLFTDPISSKRGSDNQALIRPYNANIGTPLWTTSDRVKRKSTDFGELPPEMHECGNINPYDGLPEDLIRFMNRGWEFEELIEHYWGFNSKPKDLKCLGQEVFAMIFNISFCSGIIACHNGACQRRREAFAAVAPECTWDALRNFLLMCLGCRIPKEKWSFVQDIILPESTNVYSIHLEHDVPKSFCIDIRGVLDLCRWSERIARGELDELDLGVVPDDERLNNQHSFKVWQTISPEYDSHALAVSQECHNNNICLNRLWNASFHHSNTSVGVYYLGKSVLMLEDYPIPKDHLSQMENHKQCTPQYCLHAHDNSTLAKQAHKCLTQDCEKEIEFPTSLLDKASEAIDPSTGWFNTAWYLRQPNVEPSVMKLEETNYMAVSHVWANGTGLGLKTPGRINQCLYDYFAKIAECLDCEGLWWDTISIPTERVARGAAIERMLENFEKAKVTVVHDEDLVKFPWRDDGSPAIALVLSSWFTRGWTAAELFASRRHRVKLLFADPQNPNGDPLIKDLDDDVFAVDVGEWLHTEGSNKKSTGKPGYSTRHSCRPITNPVNTIPTQGYIVAAEAMKRIRNSFMPDSQDQKLSDLLSVLLRRTTSWEKDRMLIAGLMCQDRYSGDCLLKNPNTSGPEITQLILGTLGSIEVTDLLHSEDTISNYGPWSWCPQSIFQLGHLYKSSAPSDLNAM